MKIKQSLADLTPAATLSQIISVDEQAGQLLKSIGLNPSDHEEETLQSVCQQHKWSEAEVLQWIKKNCERDNMESKSNDHATPGKASYSDSLSGWQKYLEAEIIPEITSLSSKIAADFPRVHQIHGNQYPWLKDMQWYFDKFKEVFRMYSAFEKKKFYPLVRKLDSQRGAVLDGTIRELKRGVDILEKDQKQLKKYMNFIREKSHDFENPADSCTTFRILNQNFKMLFEKLEEQFKIEGKHIIPFVNQKVH